MFEADKAVVDMVTADDSTENVLLFEGNAAVAQQSIEVLGEEQGEIGGFLKDHYSGVVAMLRRRTGSQEDAEDLAQESAMRLLRYQRLQSPDSWKRLFHRIAVNTFNDWGRRQKSALNRTSVSLDEVQIPDASATPDRLHDSREQLSRLMDTIESLPPKCQQVFLLSRKVGMSNQEIAQRLGISVRMVEKQISKALVACRCSLDNHA